MRAQRATAAWRSACRQSRPGSTLAPARSTLPPPRACWSSSGPTAECQDRTKQDPDQRGGTPESTTHLSVFSTIGRLISFTCPVGYSTCFNHASTSSVGYSHVCSTNSFELEVRAEGASNAWIESDSSERNRCSGESGDDEDERVAGVATIAQLCQGVGTLPMNRTSFK